MATISIIVPVYNAEKTLHRCLDSIIAQTYTDWECILIDDGSKDNSPAICNEYAEKDSRFKVIHKENEGVANARNDGLYAANGEWVAFADSDDWMEDKMLETLVYETLHGFDIVMCDFYSQNEPGKEEYVTQKPKALDPVSVLEDFFEGNLIGTLWNKLIRKKCFESYDIHFPKNISFMEDIFVICLILLHNVKIGYVPKALYHYKNINTGKNLSSLMYQRNSTKDIDGLTYFIDYFEKEIKDKKVTVFLMNRKFFYKSIIWNKNYRNKKNFIYKYKEVNGIMVQSQKMPLSMKLALTKGYYLGALAFKISLIIKQIKGKGSFARILPICLLLWTRE